MKRYFYNDSGVHRWKIPDPTHLGVCSRKLQWKGRGKRVPRPEHNWAQLWLNRITPFKFWKEPDCLSGAPFLPDRKPEPDGCVDVKGRKAELDPNLGLVLPSLGLFLSAHPRDHVT